MVAFLDLLQQHFVHALLIAQMHIDVKCLQDLALVYKSCWYYIGQDPAPTEVNHNISLISKTQDQTL